MFKEMPQRHEQLRRVSDPTLVERFVNVINDHGSDGFAAMGLRQQVTWCRMRLMSENCQDGMHAPYPAWFQFAWYRSIRNIHLPACEGDLGA